MNKLCYLISNISFLFICLSGLIWQVTQISINYFKFEVVSSITVIMPGIEGRKGINLCFQSHQLLYHDRFIELINKKGEKNVEYFYCDPDRDTMKDLFFRNNFTVREQLNITLDAKDLFLPGSEYHSYYDSEKYLMGNLICYKLVSHGEAMMIRTPTSPRSYA